MGKYVLFCEVRGKIVCLICNKEVSVPKEYKHITVYKGKSDVLEVNLKEDKVPISATAAKLLTAVATESNEATSQITAQKFKPFMNGMSAYNEGRRNTVSQKIAAF
jgi:hypothetical protein